MRSSLTIVASLAALLPFSASASAQAQDPPRAIPGSRFPMRPRPSRKRSRPPSRLLTPRTLPLHPRRPRMHLPPSRRRQKMKMPSRKRSPGMLPPRQHPRAPERPRLPQQTTIPSRKRFPVTQPRRHPRAPEAPRLLRRTTIPSRRPFPAKPPKPLGMTRIPPPRVICLPASVPASPQVILVTPATRLRRGVPLPKSRPGQEGHRSRRLLSEFGQLSGSFGALPGCYGQRSH